MGNAYARACGTRHADKEENRNWDSLEIQRTLLQRLSRLEGVNPYAQETTETAVDVMEFPNSCPLVIALTN